MTKSLAKKEADIEAVHDRTLTPRQKEFSKLYVEGIYSGSECARRAGFSKVKANVYASKLLNGRDYPHVVDYIKELREERERRYGVTMLGQLKRLAELSIGAEEAGQYSAAINAEKIRSSLGGLTVDRRETMHKIDDMSRDEIVNRLSQLRQQFPQAFIEGEYEDVTDGTGSREPVLAIAQEETTEENTRHED
jgi:DNA-binding CsgD family transcriptional regulator